MCCFSQPVISVSATKIFARAGEGDRQFLVYSMTLGAKQDLAMVLPIPVKVRAGEKDVEFIDLSGYPNFFADIDRGFPTPVLPPTTSAESAPASVERLTVVKVGSFEASFVPTLKDFSRLDERFRIPVGAWKKLPRYANYGFAVFKLKSGTAKIHPMAFSFPRRDLKTLFFPTVHIHDGDVHPKADFDHTLYCQPTEHEPLQTRNWEESKGHANGFVNVPKTNGIVVPDQHCYKKLVQGELPNQDMFIAIAA
jgi:hypothetical protein